MTDKICSFISLQLQKSNFKYISIANMILILSHYYTFGLFAGQIKFKYCKKCYQKYFLFKMSWVRLEKQSNFKKDIILGCYDVNMVHFFLFFGGIYIFLNWIDELQIKYWTLLPWINAIWSNIKLKT